MLPDKVKALFQFIDYLDSNRQQYIETYVPLCNECLDLMRGQDKLKPQDNYKDKKAFRELHNQINEKFEKVKSDVVTPILNELLRLGVWTEDRYFESIYSRNIGSVTLLKETFTDADVNEIQDYKRKYFAFRREVNSYFLSLQFLFDRLDDVLKPLFDFFKDDPGNEFEGLERLEMAVSDFREMGDFSDLGDISFRLDPEGIKDFGNKEKSYHDFEALFKDAVTYRAIGEINNQQSYLVKQSYFNLAFNGWLQETKGWQYGDNQQYVKYLTKHTFLEFLTYHEMLNKEQKAKHEEEAESWSPGIKNVESKPLLYAVQMGNVVPPEDPNKLEKYLEVLHSLNTISFRQSISKLKPDEIKPELQFHLRSYQRKGGEPNFWLMETKKQVSIELSPKQRDAYLMALDEMSKELEKTVFPAESDTIKGDSANKPSISAYALMHVYLAMYGGQPVTKQNKDQLAKKYGYSSGDHLRNEFTAFQNEDKRLDLHTINKRSANTHLDRFKAILPILKEQNEKAYSQALEDFTHLENEYKKYY